MSERVVGGFLLIGEWCHLGVDGSVDCLGSSQKALVDTVRQILVVGGVDPSLKYLTCFLKDAVECGIRCRVQHPVWKCALPGSLDY